MSTRKFFFISLILAVLAIGVHVPALGHLKRGSRAMARAASLPEAERAAAKDEARQFSSRAKPFLYVEYAVALASLGFVVASARRNESAWQFLTIALLSILLMLQLV